MVRLIMNENVAKLGSGGDARVQHPGLQVDLLWFDVESPVEVVYVSLFQRAALMTYRLRCSMQLASSQMDPGLQTSARDTQMVYIRAEEPPDPHNREKSASCHLKWTRLARA